MVVNEALVVPVNCEAPAALRGYDLARPDAPTMMWEIPVGDGCLESTPAMWDGRIYVGSRDGFFYAVGEP